MYLHPADAECAVIGTPHEHWGEQVHAIVILKPGQALTERELIDHTKTLIAGYKCPGSVCFLEHSQPRSGAKRILKN